MPGETLGSVPAGIVDNEQPAFGTLFRDLLGQEVQVILEDIGIDPVEYHRATFFGARTHRADDLWSAAPSAPALAADADHPQCHTRRQTITLWWDPPASYAAVLL